MLKTNKGTPTNIQDAIKNALDEVSELRRALSDVSMTLAASVDEETIIQKHIRDFLAQKFSIAMYQVYDNAETESQFKDLFNKCTQKRAA